MPTVELLIFPDCPNVPAAREQLTKALAEVGFANTWTEHDVTAEGAPPHVRGYGSPTILVDGRDVTGATPGDGSTCRVYTGGEVRGAPSLEAIIAALRGS